MFCTRCGKDIKEGNRFCEGCGALAPQGEERSASPAAATRPLASVGDSSTMPLPVMAGMSDDRNPSSTASKAFCTGCGASLQEGTAFCTRCGKAVSGADAPLPQRSRDGASKAESSKKSSSNKGLIIGLVAAGVVLLVAAGVVLYLLFGQSAQSIEPVAADAPAASVETPQKASNAAEEDAATYDELKPRSMRQLLQSLRPLRSRSPQHRSTCFPIAILAPIRPRSSALYPTGSCSWLATRYSPVMAGASRTRSSPSTSERRAGTPNATRPRSSTRCRRPFLPSRSKTQRQCSLSSKAEDRNICRDR